MEKYNKEYLKLNKNILLAFFASVIISAIAAQLLSVQANYVNSSATLGVDLSIYYLTFAIFFYLDNRKNYVLESGELDKARLKTDLMKIISSLGISEIIYSIFRWILQYYMLTANSEAYVSSIIAQSIAFLVYLICVNFLARKMRLYKE